MDRPRKSTGKVGGNEGQKLLQKDVDDFVSAINAVRDPMGVREWAPVVHRIGQLASKLDVTKVQRGEGVLKKLLREFLGPDNTGHSDAIDILIDLLIRDESRRRLEEPGTVAVHRIIEIAWENWFQGSTAFDARTTRKLVGVLTDTGAPQERLRVAAGIASLIPVAVYIRHPLDLELLFGAVVCVLTEELGAVDGSGYLSTRLPLGNFVQQALVSSMISDNPLHSVYLGAVVTRLDLVCELMRDAIGVSNSVGGPGGAPLTSDALVARVRWVDVTTTIAVCAMAAAGPKLTMSLVSAEAFAATIHDLAGLMTTRAQMVLTAGVELKTLEGFAVDLRVLCTVFPEYLSGHVAFITALLKLFGVSQQRKRKATDDTDLPVIWNIIAECVALVLRGPGKAAVEHLAKPDVVNALSRHLWTVSTDNYDFPVTRKNGEPEPRIRCYQGALSALAAVMRVGGAAMVEEAIKCDVVGRLATLASAVVLEPGLEVKVRTHNANTFLMQPYVFSNRDLEAPASACFLVADILCMIGRYVKSVRVGRSLNATLFVLSPLAVSGLFLALRSAWTVENCKTGALVYPSRLLTKLSWQCVRARPGNETAVGVVREALSAIRDGVFGADAGLPASLAIDRIVKSFGNVAEDGLEDKSCPLCEKRFGDSDDYETKTTWLPCGHSVHSVCMIENAKLRVSKHKSPVCGVCHRSLVVMKLTQSPAPWNRNLLYGSGKPRMYVVKPRLLV
jgi:hypothetical protein